MKDVASHAEVLAETSTWPSSLLGEIVDVLDSKRKPITKRDRVAGPYPYYGATGVLDMVEGYLFDEPLVLIGEDGAKWGAGDQSAFAISGKTWVNNHAHVLRPRRDRILDDWLIYYLNAADLSEFISGMTVPKLNQGRLREIPIPLPPLEEQKRIVAVLDQAFAALDRARDHAEANLADARQMQSAFVTRAIENAAEGHSSRLKLGEFCNIARGGSPRPIKKYLTASSNGINWIKISDASASGQFIEVTREKIIPEGVSRSRFVRSGAFLLTNSMSFGRPYVLHTDGCIHDGWLVLEPDYSRVEQDFLYYLLGSSQVYGNFDRLAAGSTVRNLNIGLVSNVVVTLPSVQRQKEAVSKIAKHSKKMQALERLYDRHLADIADLRQSLLQRAFSGQLTT